MIRMLGRRSAQMVVTLLFVSLLIFSILRLTPGDPARLLLPEDATPDMVADMRASLGLDRPLYTQYVLYMSAVLTGDLGMSIRMGTPNADLIRTYLPNTIRLTASALLLAALLGLFLGVVSALRRGSVWDFISLVIAILGQSMSAIWLGPVLIFTFAVKLHWFPTFGSDSLLSLVLPAVTLGFPLVAIIARLTRVSVLEVLGQDHVRTARAKGLAERVVTFRHTLRNALIPVATIIGLQLGTLMGGAVVTETIFSFQGLGRLVVTAIAARDYPLVQAITLVISFFFVVINSLVDLSYFWLDPRVRFV